MLGQVLLAGEENGLLRRHVDWQHRHLVESRDRLEGRGADELLVPISRDEGVIVLLLILMLIPLVDGGQTITDVVVFRSVLLISFVMMLWFLMLRGQFLGDV